MTRPRILIRRVHLWLGLSLGLLFALLGLTGSALVFYVELDSTLHPPSRAVAHQPAPGWESPAWDRALAIGRVRWPEAGGKWSFEATGQGGAIPARYYPPSAAHDHHAPRQMVWFAQNGGRIVRAEPWGGYLMSWLYELHMHLLAGETGRQIVGWSGVATLLLLVTGIMTWWPRGRWGKALAFKPRAAPIRRLRDLHKLTGLWSAAALLILSATGVLLALPAVKTVLLSPTPMEPPRSRTSAGTPISVTAALSATRRAIPDGRLAFIDVPDRGDAPFRVRVGAPGDPHLRFPSSNVFVDQYSGRVLAVHDIRRGNFGARIAAWVRPLHDGSVGGTAVRILAVIAGVMPAVLLVTGLLHWRRRHLARPLPTPKNIVHPRNHA